MADRAATQASPSGGGSLLHAYATFRQAFLELKAQPSDLSDADAQAFYARMDPADAIMRTVPSLTAADVIAKLKRAFVGIVGEQWTDDAIRDERPATFEQSVRLADMPVELLWRAIEDLERIDGEARS